VTRYAIGLGSNVGERLDHLRFAIRELGRVTEVVSVSSLYETAPMGGPDQGPYLNAVAIVGADLDGDSMLAVCHSIEAGAGRVRDEHWGPRTLDLDILASDDPAETALAAIPHPRVTEREFALRPLAEVWPEAVVGSGLTASEGLAVVERQGVDRLTKTWVPTGRPPLGDWLVVAQFALIAAVGLLIFSDGGWGGWGPLQIAGVAAAGGGLVLAALATRQLGVAMTPNPDPRPEAELVERGVYRLVRHPVYGGVTLLMFGAAMTMESRAGLVGSAVLTGFFLLKITYEERRLRMRYGGYSDYMARVRRRLIPFLV
jgi:2-amino-4-hydroxy-6-hydroxymethyldihydropteridine diphosphokinase